MLYREDQEFLPRAVCFQERVERDRAPYAFRLRQPESPPEEFGLGSLFRVALQSSQRTHVVCHQSPQLRWRPGAKRPLELSLELSVAREMLVPGQGLQTRGCLSKRHCIQLQDTYGIGQRFHRQEFQSHLLR